MPMESQDPSCLVVMDLRPLIHRGISCTACELLLSCQPLFVANGGLQGEPHCYLGMVLHLGECVMRTLAIAMGCTVTLAVAAQSRGQQPQYIAVDLTPAGCAAAQGNGAGGGVQVGYGNVTAAGGRQHAMLWRGSATSVVDLNPSWATESQAWGAGGVQQVGYGNGPATGLSSHALLWKGTADSVIDLNPNGFSQSRANGTDGIQQVGDGYKPGMSNAHAILWSGTADSWVDLNPAGFIGSGAYAVSGGKQVGSAFSPTDNYNHAMLWSGTAGSAVDLHPSGYTWTHARAIAEGQQAGSGQVAGLLHALLWSGTAEGVIDLNSSTLTQSQVEGMIPGLQVGWGIGSLTGNNQHAVLWRGTASSAVDLHAYLGANYRHSFASGIDVNGIIMGASQDIAGRPHAIAWIPVPEPATLTLLALGGLLIARRRA
jgi:hypothetical protein